jgi:membrane protein implicated in regulation of membrane protease activity
MTSTSPSKRAPGPADDSGGGLVVLVVFTAAVLIVTAAVALLALVGGWWMLGLAFAVHVGMTAVVVLTILHVMYGRVRAIADRDRPSPSADRRFEGRPRTGNEAVTVP